MVSDFITPSFYDLVATQNGRYSFTGAVTAPRQILPGGYISWVNHETNEMQQLLYVDPGPPTIHNLGPASAASLRVWVDGQMRKGSNKDTFRPYESKLNKTLMKRWSTKRSNLESIAGLRAALYR